MENKVSCIIHTYNSEDFLEACLESVKWADEIVIVDMHSTDRTVEIAQKYGARIFTFENKGYADPARKFGQDQCRYDWILALDSDEIMPQALHEELQKVIAQNHTDVVYFSFRNFFFGREVQYTGWSYKDILVPRFYKKGCLTYGDQVHNFIQITQGARILKLIRHDLAIIHFAYKSVRHFIQKLNNYTDAESVKYPNKVHLIWHIPYQILREFGGRFIVKKGYLDGWLGFYLSFGMAFYRVSALVKKEFGTDQDGLIEYRKLIEKIKRGDSV